MAATTSPKGYKITFLGDSGTGKSALILQLTRAFIYAPYQPEVENYDKEVFLPPHEPVTVRCLEHISIDPAIPVSMKHLQIFDGVVIVYSVTSRSSFESVEKWFEKVLYCKDVSYFPTLILGNKNDMGEEERQVSTDEGSALAAQLGCQFQEVSALQIGPLLTALFNIARELTEHGAPRELDRKPPKRGPGCTVS